MTQHAQPDLHATRQAILNGQTSPAEQAELSLSIARSPACEHVFRQLTPHELLDTTNKPDITRQPLVGLSVSIKDLFDVQGQVTAAGSVVLADAAPAQHDCPAVARLRAAGAGLIGRTHMVEFAFSGVGNNPHFGTPAAWDGRYHHPAGQGDHAPGGSSSGAAVSVATGAAFIGLGSDTGGSIRVPAALNGIVGFKNTARTTPTQGVLPLSTTLDTVSAMTRSVRDAILTHEILSGTRVPDRISWVRMASRTLRVMADTVSRVVDSGNTPCVGVVRAVFLKPTMPFRAAGTRIEPPVSEPKPMKAAPVATETAAPELEPPGA